MLITIVGATGFLGGHLIQQGLERGFELRAVAPDAGKHPLDPRVRVYNGGSADSSVLVEAFAGADAVISVFPPNMAHPETYADELRGVMAACLSAGVSRFVAVVGSAGTLVAPGQHLVDTDYFQETTRHFYQGVHVGWSAFEDDSVLDWTAVVPAARMQRHLPRKGRYRTRTDRYLVTDDPESRRYFDTSQISYADFATAVFDVAASPEFRHQFVTTGW